MLIGTMNLTKGYVDHWNDSETAAWWTELEYAPQSVEVTAEVAPDGRLNKDVHYAFAGQVVDEWHGALFGGVPVGTRPYEKRGIGEMRTRHFRTYAYAFAGWLAKANDTYAPTDRFFMPTVELEMRTHTHERRQHRLPPNPLCECGAVLRTTTEDERTAMTPVREYAHVDGSDCTSSHCWPAKSQWLTFNTPHVIYDLWVVQNQEG